MNKEKSLISVVIPVFNKNETIFRAVKSVTDQSRKAAEIIVVDDGSSDGSAEIVENGFPDITLIRQSNAGVSCARNKGINTAESEYVAFLDGDDWWEETVLEKFEGLISRYKSAVMYSVSHYRVNGKSTHSPNSGAPREGLLTGPDFIDLYAKYSGIINSSSACVRKDAVIRIGGFPEEYDQGEDIHVWLSLALCGKTAISNDRLVYIERSEEDMRNSKGRVSVPAYIQEFCSLNGSATLCLKERKTLSRFLVRRGLIHCLGLVLKGKRSDVLKIGMLIARRKKFILPVFLLLYAVPSKPLFMFYKFRNKTKG